MATIRALTLLPRDSLIRVKVRATNDKGTGAYSQINTDGALIETEPTNLSVVSIIADSTTNTQTEVAWTALTGSSRGGKSVDIVMYEVFWDQSSNNWVYLDNTTSLTSLKTGLTGGVTYSFKVRAYNKYGFGEFTSSVSVQTSQPPAKPDAPTLTVEGGYVKIAWVAPDANFRPVLAYKITIATSTGTFVEDTRLCDGSKDAQFSVRYCLVDMHDLRDAPFNLAYATLVTAKVSARNERGWGAESDANTAGATVQVEP